MSYYHSTHPDGEVWPQNVPLLPFAPELVKRAELYRDPLAEQPDIVLKPDEPALSALFALRGDHRSGPRFFWPLDEETGSYYGGDGTQNLPYEPVDFYLSVELKTGDAWEFWFRRRPATEAVPAQHDEDGSVTVPGVAAQEPVEYCLRRDRKPARGEGREHHVNVFDNVRGLDAVEALLEPVQ
jgi:hypothetical protein